MEKMCLEVEKFSNQKKFEKRNFALLLCVREALTNAIRHGCKNDMKKKVNLTLSYINEAMIIQVEDDGSGYNHKEEKSRKKNYLQTEGRGLSIINIYSDSYEFNESGNKIKIIINNT